MIILCASEFYYCRSSSSLPFSHFPPYPLVIWFLLWHLWKGFSNQLSLLEFSFHFREPPHTTFLGFPTFLFSWLLWCPVFIVLSGKKILCHWIFIFPTVLFWAHFPPSHWYPCAECSQFNYLKVSESQISLFTPGDFSCNFYIAKM